MHPDAYFSTVVEPNVQAFDVAHEDDLRLAINAVLTLDAFFGVLNAHLHANRDDSEFKKEVAAARPEYGRLRDVADAVKHGRLRHRADRSILGPGCISVHALGAGTLTCEDPIEHNALLAQTNDGSERIRWLVQVVYCEARRRLDALTAPVQPKAAA